jgi:hypothetical protein
MKNALSATSASSAVRPLSAARRREQAATFGFRESLDRIPQRGPGNRSAVRAQMALEARHVGLAGFAQGPADGLLN